jgi:pyridoxine kinase
VTRQKRALAIHDISGFGRCSLTVALPVLSAAGIECSVIPTAVLSTHTGGFSGYTYRDLTTDVLPIAQHWHRLGLTFDAIYTGYLGSFEQIELVKQVIELLRGDNTLVVVDPVMADAGKLYATFPEDFPQGMRSLCEVADVLVPNLTEAALLLGRSPDAERLGTGECVHRPSELAELLRALTGELGAAAVVLTGVSLSSGQVGAATYDAGAGTESYASAPRVGGMYHGTGDVFSSALVAGLVEGLPLAAANEVAVKFTVEAIQRSYEAHTDNRYGVNFEEGLAGLRQRITTMNS